MITTILKRIDPVKAILGLCSLANLISLKVSGLLFLNPEGPFSTEFVLKSSDHTYFKYIPSQIIPMLPYWWHITTETTLLINALLLIAFIFSLFPKVLLPLLLFFEYSLLTRTSYTFHYGQFLFLLLLILYIFETYLPAKSRSFMSAIWITQGIALYFFSGLYKNPELWLLEGNAIQAFTDFYSLVLGSKNYNWSFIGVWLSRLTYMLEIAGPIFLFLIYLWFPRKRSFFNGFLIALALIHIGSFLFFPLFTFPVIAVTFLYALHLRFYSGIQIPLMQKFLVLGIVMPFHLLPFFKVEIFPFDFFPLRQSWSVFSNVPTPLPVSSELKVTYSPNDIQVINFNKSFHWQQLKCFISFERNQNIVVKENLNRYYCLEKNAISLEWRMSSNNIKVKYDCPTL